MVRIMEFNKKLKALREQSGLTQDELAKVLYVSRTAISKWEAGRGFPNIESLKSIAKVFKVTLDELLSCEQLLTFAKRESEKKVNRIRDIIFGLLDTSVLILFFLPFFSIKATDGVHEVLLFGLSSIKIYTKIAYIIVIILSVAIGTTTLLLTAWQNQTWSKIIRIISICINAIGVAIFCITLQPYASIFLFVFLLIKILSLLEVISRSIR